MTNSAFPAMRRFPGFIRVLHAIVIGSLLLLPVAISPPVSAQTPGASPESGSGLLPEGPLGDQIGWVIAAANGDVNVTDPGVIQEHFSPEFLQEIGLPGLVAFAYGLVRTYSPVTIDSVTVDESGTSAVTMLTAADGTPLQFSLAIDPETGLIAALEIVPVTTAVGAIPAASPIASPAASPEASPVSVVPEAPAWADIGDDYLATVATIEANGQQAVTAFLDGADLAGMFREDLQPQVPAGLFEQSLDDLTTNRISLQSDQFGAKLDAHVSKTLMQGYFFQGVLTTFALTPDDSQESGVPTGRWSGSLDNGALEFSIEFSGTEDALTATLDVPSQGISGSPLTNVAFEEERPIGDLLDARVQALGDPANSYAALYQWGAVMLKLEAIFDGSGALTGFSTAPQWPLPDDPATGTVSASLPFSGAWLVAWGGTTEFQNYHAVSPQQRHAYDVLVWRDGSSHTGDGTQLEDFYAYGQQALAPVGGTVVAVVNDAPDMPSIYAQMTDPAVMTAELMQRAQQNPAGNHVVIETDEGVFVFVAHMQPGSVQVTVGDTVEPGEVIGLVGNSGNTSEPHIHIHAQTSADIYDPEAIGVPITFDTVFVNGEPVDDAFPVVGDIVESQP